MLSKKQIANGVAVLRGVEERTHRQNWMSKRARRMARMTIMCCLTESQLRVYANVNNPESLRLPHDAVGSDHASVGVFQQQVPSWGSTADCMDPKTSCHKFMDRAAQLGVDDFNHRPLRLNIQSVQVSFDPGGWNYAVNWGRAHWFVWRHWNTRARVVKGDHR